VPTVNKYVRDRETRDEHGQREDQQRHDDRARGSNHAEQHRRDSEKDECDRDNAIGVHRQWQCGRAYGQEERERRAAEDFHQEDERSGQQEVIEHTDARRRGYPVPLLCPDVLGRHG